MVKYTTGFTETAFTARVDYVL